MNRLVRWVDSVLSWTVVILMVVMVLDVTWQVFTRFVMRNPSSFTEELATFLLIWLGLLGGAYALRLNAHLGIDVLTIRLSPERRYLWEFVIYAFVIIFSVLVLLWGGIRLVNITLYLNQISAALRIKMGYVYVVLPITGALLIFYSVYFMLAAAQGLKSHRFELLNQQKTGID